MFPPQGNSLAKLRIILKPLSLSPTPDFKRIVHNSRQKKSGPLSSSPSTIILMHAGAGSALEFVFLESLVSIFKDLFGYE